MCRIQDKTLAGGVHASVELFKDRLADKPVFNPGDRVQINLFIWGTSPITGMDNMLLVHIPPVLLKGGVMERSVTVQGFTTGMYEDGTVQSSARVGLLSRNPYTFR
jgi:hypothetical protein